MENPMNYFYNQRVKFMTQDHIRGGGYPDETYFNNVQFQRSLDIYKERFANASDFTFVFVGNFTEESITPMIEKYVGSLPSNDQKESWKDLNIRPPKGVVRKEVFRGDEAKSLVYVYFHNEYDYDRKTNYHLSSLAEVLDIKLLEILREEQSGVYSVGAYSRTEKFPYQNYQLIVVFPCGPENVEALEKTAYEEIRKIQDNGVSDEDMTKIKETQKREIEVSLKKNGFWQNIIKNSIIYEWDLEEILKYESRIEELSSDDIQKVAREFFDFESKATVVLYPETTKE